ncbi:MAG: apolipoprotein N-acyltransferase [Spirochaetota bacterium]|nr:apolipoprotein N-acyltransferase [Spirochaetota bacterium]
MKWLKFAYLLGYGLIAGLLSWLVPSMKFEYALSLALIPAAVGAYYYRDGIPTLCSLLAGHLVFLSFPDMNYWPLIFLAFIPLFYLAQTVKSYKALFYYGLLTGITISVGGFYWLVHTIVVFGKLPTSGAVTLFILYSLVFYLKVPVILMGLRWVEKNVRFNRILTYTLVITLGDFLVPELFPWYFGGSQYQNLYFIQISDITSILGVTFLIGLVNALIYEVYTNIRDKKPLPVKWIATGVSIIIISYVYGFVRVSQIRELQSKAQPVNVAVVQPDTPMFRKDRKKVLRILKEKSHEIAKEAQEKGEKLDLLVWPESAAPFAYRYDYGKAFRKLVNDLAKTYDMYVFFGHLDIERSPKGRKHYNAAAMVSPQLKVTEQYHKMYPLAFGEYLPLGPLDGWFPKLKPWMRKNFHGVGDFEKGTKMINFDFPKGKLVPQICYEIIIPDFTRQFFNQGGEIIINITNDMWFGDTKASKLHLVLALFRAIENRAPMVRSTNSGISTFINPLGEIVSRETPLYKVDALRHKIYPPKIKTFYTRFGDVFGYLLFGTFVLVSLVSRFKPTRP